MAMRPSLYRTYSAVSFVVGLVCGIFFRQLALFAAESSSHMLNLLAIESSAPDTSNLASWQAPSALRDYEPLGVEDTDEPWWENFDTNRTIYLSVLYGLGNTIPAIASALTVAHREKINMKFIFNTVKNGFNMGPAQWNELFSFPQINPDHRFPDGDFAPGRTKACKNGIPRLYYWSQIEGNIKWIPEEDGSGEYACYTASHWREPPFPESGLWFLRNLRPTDEIQAHIKEFKEQQEWNKYQWIGVHLRRSDNFGWMRTALKYESQEELQGRVNKTSLDTMLPMEHYIESMKKVESNWPLHQLGKHRRVKPPKFYLATDNDEARQQILDSFDDGKIVFFDNDKYGRAARKDIWSMKVAVIEMYLVAECQVLIGTPFSTFSEGANFIGNNLYLETDFEYMK